MNPNTFVFGNQPFLSEQQLFLLQQNTKIQYLEPTTLIGESTKEQHSQTHSLTNLNPLPSPVVEMCPIEDDEGEEMLTPEETRQFIMLTNRMRNSLMGLN
jgi:hypothetical protein